ncbi:hypothetical protein SAMN04515674_101506 [Pseudarcicella hirudinis]|uniref:Uncharacterized protein n=1 Tax=Pseudarcicella hirudinis TaxID=1079859 RepID=A0A1I5MYG5_9BACT|nr:hypothetical protein [Pseudarcicella hirudinis]SFP14462.1 hypothetical protein SAMN04515674_101506 [Pseudarcicella hirudinis]
MAKGAKRHTTKMMYEAIRKDFEDYYKKGLRVDVIVPILARKFYKENATIENILKGVK